METTSAIDLSALVIKLELATPHFSDSTGRQGFAEVASTEGGHDVGSVSHLL